MDDILFHADEYILKAKDLIDGWQYIEAKRVLEQLIDDEPNHGPAHNLTGWLFFHHLDNPKQAAKHYQLAIQYAPNFPYTYRNYVQLLVYVGAYQDAINWVDRALLITEVEKEILLAEKGKAYELLQHFPEAARYYHEAMLATVDDDKIEDYESALARVETKRHLKQTLVLKHNIQSFSPPDIV